ncbi:hypothetical protein ACFQL9_10800 [Halobaculum lipolyticum]|uniref:Uncharacterized protein n=1 Tax=Halobaculum lipolyticum TaxID=3032001 RepID=A0ABD5WDT6_9EURY
MDGSDEWIDAAVVLQHGTCPEHFELASRLAVAAIDSTEMDASEWVRLSYDRWQVSLGEPQRYGTQSGTVPVNAECHLPIPTSINASEVVTTSGSMGRYPISWANVEARNGEAQ